MRTGITDADVTQKLQADVAEKLANLGTDANDTAKGEAEVLAEKSTPDPDASTQQVQAVTQPAIISKPEAGDQKTTVATTTTSDSPTLPDAYRRAAIHQGWNDEQIDKFSAADPVRALETLKQIYNSNNNLSRTFSEFGQIKRQMEEQAAQTAIPAPVVAPVVPVVQPAIDIAELKKQYGDDPLVEVIQQLATKVNDLSTSVPNQPVVAQPAPLTQPAPVFQPVQPQYSTFNEVNDFFASNELEAYKDFYGAGNDYNALTPGEFANRYQVGQTAGTILAGAELKGERMPMREALQRSHMIHSQPYLEKAILKGIQDQLVTRSANLTIRPGAAPGADTQSLGKPANRTEVEQRAADRMAKIGL